MKKPIGKTRRLTKAEATRLGVSHKAKRRVAVNLKRVTKRTVLYTDREAAQASIRNRTGNAVSKEKYTKSRVNRRTFKRTGGLILEFKGLRKPALFKKLRQFSDRPVLLKFFVLGKVEAGSRYSSEDLKNIGEGYWKSAQATIEARELLDKDNWEAFLEENDADDAELFGLIVY